MEESPLDNQDAKDKASQFAYLDLLASTLTEHEKNLDKLIDRLEKLSENLTKAGKPRRRDESIKFRRETGGEEAPEALIYIKLRLDRPIGEIKEILESLKG